MRHWRYARWVLLLAAVYLIARGISNLPDEIRPFDFDWYWTAEESVEVTGSLARVRRAVLNVDQWVQWYDPVLDEAVFDSIQRVPPPRDGHGVGASLSWTQDGDRRVIECRDRIDDDTIFFSYVWAGGRLLRGRASVVPVERGRARVTLWMEGNADDFGLWYDMALTWWLSARLGRELRESLHNLALRLTEQDQVRTREFAAMRPCTRLDEVPRSPNRSRRPGV